jgi:hypothetical protein
MAFKRFAPFKIGYQDIKKHAKATHESMGFDATQPASRSTVEISLIFLRKNPLSLCTCRDGVYISQYIPKCTHEPVWVKVLDSALSAIQII